MYKAARIDVFDLSVETYNTLPFPEESTSDNKTHWKQFDNVTFFRTPFASGATRARIQFIPYKNENDLTVRIDSGE